MIVTGGYSVWYEKNTNRIIVSLPQTTETATNTITAIANRKHEFTDSELCTILSVTKAIAEGIWNG